ASFVLPTLPCCQSRGSGTVRASRWVMPRLSRPLKIVVACVLLAALAWGVDWREMPAHLARLDWVLGGLAVLAVVFEMPVNAWKWWWSLRLHDLRFSWVYLLRTGCFGFF